MSRDSARTGFYVPLPAAPRAFMHSLSRTPFGSVSGNARLTALNGLILLFLLFIEGMTLLAIQALFGVHTFVGWLLLPPILLKLATTGYRFVQYYTGNPAYRAAGPPPIILRLDAPVLVATTVGLFASGIILLVQGPIAGDVWRSLHILFFLLWFMVMTIHVLGHSLRAFSLTWQDVSRRGQGERTGGLPGLLGRQSLVSLALLVGLVVAIAAVPLNAPWDHVLSQFGGDG